MKKKTIKLTDSTLTSIIKEAVNEYRGDGYKNRDGDRYYTSPNGNTNFHASSFVDGKMGKRALGNSNNRFTGGMYKTYGPTDISHGKGHLCYEVMKFLEEKFQVDIYGKPSGKIEWTEKEQKAIDKITTALNQLASLTKKEGNKKRGYDGSEGPEESDEDIKATMSESRFRNHIYKKVKNHLNEYDDPKLLGGGRVFKKLSELTFDEIMSILGEEDHFNMHYDESDAKRHVGSEFSFERVKEQLMDKFGDVMISINPEAKWFDKVKIEDEDWKRASEEYRRGKREFLAGCKYTD